jgi:RHS repeat-associated protein
VLEGQSAVRTFLNGVTDKTYLHGPRGPEYERIGNNAPLWYLYDGLGSVLGTIDQNGNLVQTRKYDVYGAVRSSTGGSGTKHKFVGALGHPSEDETGLIYMRARYMDPVTGRFVSEDPAKDSINWYGYARTNPVNCVDTDGQITISGTLATMAISGVFAAFTYAAYERALGRTPTWQGTLMAFLIGAAGALMIQALGALAAAAGWAGLASVGVGAMPLLEFIIGVEAAALGGAALGASAAKAGKAMKIVTGYMMRLELMTLLSEVDLEGM